MARNDKRIRLIEAADTLFHEKGYKQSTLANIADLAKVPLGNVYYYFKSKESIVMAVIEHRRRQFQELAKGLEVNGAGQATLANFVNHFVNNADEMARFGDALGSLCQELSKDGEDSTIASAAAELMTEVLTWIEKHYQIMGRGDASKTSAANLFATLQGISLLTVTFSDPELVVRNQTVLNDLIAA